jgi:hypothetical protein
MLALTTLCSYNTFYCRYVAACCTCVLCVLLTTASPRFQSSPGGYGYSSDNALTNAMTHNSSSFFSGKQLHAQQAHVQQHIQHTQLQHQLQHQVQQQQQHAAAGRTAAASEAATLRTYSSAGCISLQASHFGIIEVCRTEPLPHFPQNHTFRIECKAVYQ